jgi:hypothetical protein
VLGLSLAALILSGAACDAAGDSGVTIRLTSPQGKAVPFSGWYEVQSTGDRTTVAASTPRDYSVSIGPATEVVRGEFAKEPGIDTDTLRLEVLVGGISRMSGETDSWVEALVFQVTITP